jgi:hypothetical protein
MRFRLKSLMLAVATVSVFMAGWHTLRPALVFNNGPHQFILNAGQAVIACGTPGETIAVRASAPGGVTVVPVGTKCIVVNDDAKTMEDRWTDRTIVVRIADEPHREK